MVNCSCDTLTSSTSTTACNISNTSTGKALEVSHSATSGDCSSFTSATSGACVTGNNTHSSAGVGIKGLTSAGKAIYGVASSTGNGVYGSSISGAGVVGASYYSHGISASSTDGHGINAITTNGIGINGASTNGYGVYASSINSSALLGITSGNSITHYGVYGQNNSSYNGGPGVYGNSVSGNGVFGTASGNGAQVYGVYGKNLNTTASSGHIGAGICGEALGQYAYGVIGTCTANYGTGGKFFGGNNAGSNGIGVNSYGSLYGVYATSTENGTGIYTSGSFKGIEAVTSVEFGTGGTFSSNGNDGIGIFSYGTKYGILTESPTYGGKFTGLGTSSVGVYAISDNIAIKANASNNANGTGGDFIGGSTGKGITASGSIGVYGTGTSYGLHGHGSSSYAVGVYGYGPIGIHGNASNSSGIGLKGTASNTAIFGEAGSVGVYGNATSMYGKGGYFTAFDQGIAIYAKGQRYGVQAENTTGTVSDAAIYAYANNGPYAAHLVGNVNIVGTLYKTAGSFIIDHPLDPTNKNLIHSFVESPERKNIYDGITVCDKEGKATINLPEYFEALNDNFRYSLTAIGTSAPDLHVSKEILNNCFEISGGIPGMKVSWFVTGCRNDAWAKANPAEVEVNKPEDQIGYYLNPECFGKDNTFSVNKNIRENI